MTRYEKHIFICTNQRPADHQRGSCDPSGQGDLHRLFKTKLAQRGVKAGVRANKAGCLDQCEHGPTVVVYPEAVWYAHVKAEDVDEIIESHIVGNRTVDRLILADECHCGKKWRTAGDSPAVMAGDLARYLITSYVC